MNNFLNVIYHANDTNINNLKELFHNAITILLYHILIKLTTPHSLFYTSRILIQTLLHEL